MLKSKPIQLKLHVLCDFLSLQTSSFLSVSTLTLETSVVTYHCYGTLSHYYRSHAPVSLFLLPNLDLGLLDDIKCPLHLIQSGRFLRLFLVGLSTPLCTTVSSVTFPDKVISPSPADSLTWVSVWLCLPVEPFIFRDFSPPSSLDHKNLTRVLWARRNRRR